MMITSLVECNESSIDFQHDLTLCHHQSFLNHHLYNSISFSLPPLPFYLHPTLLILVHSDYLLLVIFITFLPWSFEPHLSLTTHPIPSPTHSRILHHHPNLHGAPSPILSKFCILRISTSVSEQELFSLVHINLLINTFSTRFLILENTLNFTTNT